MAWFDANSLRDAESLHSPSLDVIRSFSPDDAGWRKRVPELLAGVSREPPRIAGSLRDASPTLVMSAALDETRADGDSAIGAVPKPRA